jgi:hypothetical protein
MGWGGYSWVHCGVGSGGKKVPPEMGMGGGGGGGWAGVGVGDRAEITGRGQGIGSLPETGHCHPYLSNLLLKSLPKD